MLRVKLFIVAFSVLLAAFSVRAQSIMDEKSNSMNGFFGFDGLRLSNTDLLYNQEFLKDSTYFYTKEDGVVEFQSFKKIIFDYDNQGRLLVENEFEKKDDIWNKSVKRLFNYSEAGLIEFSVQQGWNSLTQAFENQSRTFFSRSFMGLISQRTSEIYESGEWMLHRKYEYLYNNHNEIAEELSYQWNSNFLEWYPKSRKLYEYNDNQDLTSEIIQVWVDTLGVWVNKSFREYEYNDDNQLINLSQSIWNPNLEEWIEQSVEALSYNPLGQVENSNSYDPSDLDGDAKESVEATYDDNGNLNVTLFKEWNDQDGWNSYEKHVHYWSEYLIGNLDKTDDIDCFYANPHTVGLPWYCDGLLKNEIYTMSVFDQNGTLHYSQQFRGSDTFRLSKQLNNGLYMIVITGGLSTHTEKVLIRN